MKQNEIFVWYRRKGKLGFSPKIINHGLQKYVSNKKYCNLDLCKKNIGVRETQMDERNIRIVSPVQSIGMSGTPGTRALQVIANV